jgi:hypothetical protein
MKYSPSTIEVFIGFLGGPIERLGRLNSGAAQMTLSLLAERCTSLKVGFPESEFLSRLSDCQITLG